MKLSVRAKILGASLLVAAIMAVGGGFAIYYIYSLSSEIHSITDAAAEVLKQSADVQESQLYLNLSQQAESSKERSETIFAYAKVVVGLGTIFAVLISTTFGYILSKAISDPVKTLDKAARLIAQGDLTEKEINIKNKDELGTLAISFNAMAGSLHNIILEVKEKAFGLAEASQQISATNQQISAGSQSQAHQVHVISDSIGMLSSTVEQVNTSVKETSLVSNQTNAKAKEGKQVVKHSIQGMQNISLLINELGQNSSQIGDIIKLIEEIAEQTNLLALNAAIEAARAGEHGKGFSVVAEHVRKLAEKSSSSTKEINHLITKIQKGIADTVTAVDQGMSQINETGEAFATIEQYISDTTDQIQNIGEAVGQQVNLSNEVVMAIEEIAAITEETAAGNEEAAAAAQHLASLAEELRSVTEKFKI